MSPAASRAATGSTSISRWVPMRGSPSRRRRPKRSIGRSGRMPPPTCACRSATAERCTGCRRRRSCSIARASAAGSTWTWRRARACCWRRPWCSAAPPWARPCGPAACSIAGGCAVSGRLVFAETVRLGDDVAGALGEPAGAAGAAAIATILAVPGDEALVQALRGLNGEFHSEVAASAWNGIAVARIVARDGAALRGDLTAVLTALGARLPRLWLN